MADAPQAPSLTRRVGAGMAWGQGGRIVEVALTFGTAVLVVRGLNPSGFGTYSLLTNLAGAASVFIPVVTTESLGAFLPRLPDRRSRLYVAVVVALLRLAVIAAVTFAALALWNELAATIGIDGVMRRVGVVAAVYWIAQDVVNSVTGYFGMELEVRAVATWRVLGAASTLAGVGVLASANAFTTGRVLAVVAGGYLLTVAGLLTRVRRIGRPVPPDDRSLRDALALTRSTWLIGVLGFTLATQIDVLLIGALTGKPTEAAYYTSAVGVVGRAQILLLSGWFAVIIPAFGHALARGSRAQLAHAWRRAAQLVLLVSLPVNSLLLVNADELMTELFGITYAPAGRLLAWVCVFNFAVTLLVNPICVAALWALDAQRVLARWRVGAAALNLGLAFALIPPLGAMGAVVATGASATASAAVEFELARRRGAVSYPVLVAVGAGVAAAAATVPSFLVGSAGKAGLVAAVVAGVAVYVGVLLLVKPLREDDVAAAAAIHPRLDNRLLRAFARERRP